MKKGLKKFLKVSAIVFSLIIAVIIFAVIKDMRQEKVLINEVNKIVDLDWNHESIDMKIKSSGTYGRLEKIIKNYYRELYEYRKEYDEIADVVEKRNVLSIENLKKHNLEEDKIFLNNIQIKNTNLTNKLIEITSNKYILSLIKNKKLDDYYIDLYKELMLADNDDEVKEEWLRLLKSDNNYFELVNDAIDLLINNEDKWYIKKNILYIRDDALLKHYNEILDELNSVYEEKSDNVI